MVTATTPCHKLLVMLTALPSLPVACQSFSLGLRGQVKPLAVLSRKLVSNGRPVSFSLASVAMDDTSKLIADQHGQNSTLLAARNPTTSDKVLDVLGPVRDPGKSTAVLDHESKSDVVSVWKKRLITHEDPFGIHKLSSLVFTASSAIILTTGALRFSMDRGSFSIIPDFLGPVSHVFVVSNAVMCLASVRMAFMHRQGDLTARNAFLGTAVSSLFSGFFFLWVSPFAPDALDVDVVNQGCFAVLCAWNAYFILDTLLSIPEVVEGRRDRKAPEYKGRFVLDTLGYVLPIAWGLPVIGSTGYQASVLHNRQWFIEASVMVEQATHVPFLANVYYLQVMAALAASYGALFVTLRDKKLISKKQEVLGITIFSVPAMIWTIYVSALFFQHGVGYSQ